MPRVTPANPARQLAKRTAILLLAGAGLVWLASWQLPHAQAPVRKAAQMLLGQSWYRIEMGGDHLGYMYNRVAQDGLGRWQFETTTHFFTLSNDASTLSKTLTFSGAPPYRLLQATFHNNNGGIRQATLIRAAANQYVAHLQTAQDTREVSLDWQYDLDTFLGLETWLNTIAPHPGETFMLRSIDFERLRTTRKTYRVVDNRAGYTLRTTSPFAPTTTRLDKHLKPVHLQMEGVFEISRSSEAEATAIREMRNKVDYRFRLDRRLNDSHALRSLVLTPPAHLPRDFPARVTSRTPNHLPAEHLGEELDYPITHPRIQQLVQTAQAQMRSSQGAGDLVAHLLEQIAALLRYDEGRPSGSVHATLARGSGECRDFADLLTTMSRAAGLPARTVYGIAYRDDTPPGMMFHAWNEVYADGSWQAVDPTWGQRHADGTHLPLDDYHAALLMLAHNKKPVTFEVAAAAYE